MTVTVYIPFIRPLDTDAEKDWALASARVRQTYEAFVKSADQLETAQIEMSRRPLGPGREAEYLAAYEALKAKIAGLVPKNAAEKAELDNALAAAWNKYQQSKTGPYQDPRVVTQYANMVISLRSQAERALQILEEEREPYLAEHYKWFGSGQNEPATTAQYFWHRDDWLEIWRGNGAEGMKEKWEASLLADQQVLAIGAGAVAFLVALNHREILSGLAGLVERVARVGDHVVPG